MSVSDEVIETLVRRVEVVYGRLRVGGGRLRGVAARLREAGLDGEARLLDEVAAETGHAAATLERSMRGITEDTQPIDVGDLPGPVE